MQFSSSTQPPAIMPLRPNVLKGTLWRESAHAPSPGANLPFPPTPLIGREDERARAGSILQQPNRRLLTLYGAGGVGKTRLALAVASDLAESFPDGVYFVNLQDITEGGLLLSAISQALELYTLPDETILPTLIRYMRDMRALFILDNFEQLTGAAPVLAELMGSCPHLKVLVTSRTVLNLRGEQEMEVLPLALPPGASKTGTKLAEIESSPAVQLFTQRAKSVKPGFTLDESNAETIAEICARLDGLPLAMELAAARVKLLSPKALLARLEKRLQILTGGAQDLPERQQTLQNAISWSYDLLTPLEQRLFRLISVFSGGCTLDAVEATCVIMAELMPAETGSKYAEIEPLEHTTSLANKSLLRYVENSEDVRVVMLETVREYALEQLRENGEEASALEAHARYIGKLTQGADLELSGPNQVSLLDSFERELGNIRAALEWCTSADEGKDASERLEIGLWIAGELNRFWQSRSHLREGKDWLEKLLQRSTARRGAARERGLLAAGRIAYIENRMTQSRVYYQEAFDSAQARGDQNNVALALMGLGNCLLDLEEAATALKAFEQALEIRIAIGDELGLASTTNSIGIIYMVWDDPVASDYFEKAVAMFRRFGDKKRLTATLNNLGRVHLRRGELEVGEKYIAEALEHGLEVGDHWDIAYALAALAEISAARKQYRHAVILLAAANAAYETLFDHFDRYDKVTYGELQESLEKALGEEAFKAAWAEGLALDPEDARSYESASTPQPAASSPDAQPSRPAASQPTHADTELSAREIEVLAELDKGLTSAQVAEQLSLSLYTVNAHLRNIYSKLNVSSRTAAIRIAREQRVI